MKPHPSDKLSDEKRAELFRRAVEEFSEQGFKRASLNRIISSMGMSKSSFYHYFENKADLFQRTLDHSLAPYMPDYETFDFDALQADTYWPALRAIVREKTLAANRSLEVGMIGRMFWRAMENAEERALAQEPIEISTRWLVALIRRGQVLGTVRRDLPEDLLVGTVMCISTTFDRWLFEQWDGLSEDERLSLAETAVDAYKRLLRPCGPTRGDVVERA